MERRGGKRGWEERERDPLHAAARPDVSMRVFEMKGKSGVEATIYFSKIPNLKPVTIELWRSDDDRACAREFIWDDRKSRGKLRKIMKAEGVSRIRRQKLKEITRSF